MKTLTTLHLVAATFLSVAVQAQTKPAAKPAARPATAATTKTATAARPTPANATKAPAAKPSDAKATPVAAPTTATPKAATAPKEAPAAKAAAAPGSLFGKGTLVANLGVGVGLGYGYGGFGYGGAVRSVPALSLSVEKGFIDNIGPGTIGIGGMIGYRSFTHRWDSSSDAYKSTWNNFIVAARGTYHYNLLDVPRLDTYAGLTLGVRVESYSSNWEEEYGYSDSYGGAYLTSGIFLGARYYFTDKIGAFTELGYDTSLMKVGLSAKF